MQDSWQPLAAQTLAEITEGFARIFPAAEHGDLGRRTAAAWIEVLGQQPVGLGEEPTAPAERRLPVDRGLRPLRRP